MSTLRNLKSIIRVGHYTESTSPKSHRPARHLLSCRRIHRCYFSASVGHRKRSSLIRHFPDSRTYPTHWSLHQEHYCSHDGDAAGIKASIRGIDLILEEGLNVKVVLFPWWRWSDSYSRKHSHSELLDFVNTHARDFVMFKTSLLLDEIKKNDPVRKAGLIRDVVETIARIRILLSARCIWKQSSAMMDIDENLFITELNKIRRQGIEERKCLRMILKNWVIGNSCYV